VRETSLPIRRITVSVDLQLLRAFLLSLSGKIPLCSQDQEEVNDSFGVLLEQRFNEWSVEKMASAQLLQCNNCLLSVHDICKDLFA
jgi:hypothetical protein